MPTALVQIVLFGIAAGLVVECLAVLTRAEPAHQKRSYFVAALLGAAGALASIPLSMAMDWARGGPGELLPELILPIAQGPAILLVCFWIVLKRLRKHSPD